MSGKTDLQQQDYFDVAPKKDDKGNNNSAQHLFGSENDDKYGDEPENFVIPVKSPDKPAQSPGAVARIQKIKPPNVLDGLKTCDFYHGLLPEDEASDMLEKDGDFLLALTYTETSKNVVCYVKWLDKVKGYEFNQAADSLGVTLDKFNFKPTVLELVNYHYKGKIPIGNNGPKLIKSIRKQSWELDSKNLKAGRLLGEGAFGQVFYGNLTQNGKSTPVAIKIPTKKADNNKETLKKAMEEARIQREYTHNNIVRLYGVVFDANQFCIVLEYLDGGALDEFLKASNCPMKLRMAFCFDIALGMEYLHAHECLHRDMAARNCLVDRKFQCAKISDFGLSSKGDLQQVDRSKPTPIRWMAPEVLKTATFGKAADIWSMAVLFWEVYTKCKEQPYTGKDLKQVQKELFNNPDFHLEIDPQMPRELKNVVEVCWCHDPVKRPSAGKIVDYLLPHCYKARYPISHEMYKTLTFRENLVKYKKSKKKNVGKTKSRSRESVNKSRSSSKEFSSEGCVSKASRKSASRKKNLRR
ncbi:unnamed protein product [Bursaphelenchus okinawaensis]|uniref:Tyrosine-protein kinase n=1 Tax=Bursaphelenchus okinawaensis TaxID=465554 RepID=A0A811KBC5_9BILA|nr:unnamed protein product [Bursaphelenchus okinawaensis]CAG9096523.1 unnamed protein product [Bursaphelenchus okinawaensis]